MTDTTLPADFKDLERFAGDWALATERERNSRRINSSGIDELQEYYDTMMPRMEEILNFLNQYEIDDLPADCERLFHMTLSLAEVAVAVEIFKQPTVVDGFDSNRLTPMPLPHQPAF